MNKDDPRFHEYCRKCFTFVMNEVRPRANKLKISAKDFPVPPEVCGQLVEWEMEDDPEGWKRRESRRFLDLICGLVKHK